VAEEEESSSTTAAPEPSSTAVAAPAPSSTSVPDVPAPTSTNDELNNNVNDKYLEQLMKERIGGSK